MTLTLVPAATVAGSAAADNGATVVAAQDGSENASLPAGPLPDRSTEYSTTEREPDGSYTTTTHSLPVNYQDDAGAWHPIDNTLVPASGGTYEAQNAAAAYVAKIPEDPATTPVRFSIDADWVTMRLHGADNTAPAIEGSSATLSNVAKADAVTYEATGSGLKESIVLDTPPATASLSYVYDIDAAPGLTPSLDDTGDLVFRQVDGSVRVRIPAGTMYDSATPVADSGDVSYNLTAIANGWSLQLTPNVAWLTDPQRVYPVVIDPTVTSPKVVSRDCYIMQANVTASHCAAPYVQVGGTNATDRYRGLLDFDVFAGVPATAIVSKATAHLYMDGSQSLNHQGANYALFRAGSLFDGNATWSRPTLTTSWDGGSPVASSATDNLSLTGYDSGSGYKQFDVTNIVDYWMKYPAQETGLVLKQNDGTRVDNELYFYSNVGSNPVGTDPYLTYTYTLPPSADQPSISIEATDGTTVGDIASDIANVSGPVQLVLQTHQGDDWLTIGTRVSPSDDLHQQIQEAFDAAASDDQIVESAGAALDEFKTKLDTDELNVTEITASEGDQSEFSNIADGEQADLATLTSDDIQSGAVDDGLETPYDLDDLNQGNSADPDYSDAPMDLSGNTDPTGAGTSDSPFSPQVATASTCDPDGWFSPRSTYISGYTYWDTTEHKSGYLQLAFRWTAAHLVPRI